MDREGSPRRHTRLDFRPPTYWPEEPGTLLTLARIAMLDSDHRASRRSRRLRPHPFAELRDSEELCRHLVADHDYETGGPHGRFTGVCLLHQTIDILIGVIGSVLSRYSTATAAQKDDARNDLARERLNYLVTEHVMDHD